METGYKGAGVAQGLAKVLRGRGNGRAEDAMGLILLIAGLALFLGTHLVTTQRVLRARLIARLGEGGYKAIYTIASFAGIGLIAYGFSLYRATSWIDVWY